MGMRERLSKSKDACYTYSEEYQSMTVPLVNAEAMEEKEKQDKVAKFMTKTGFKYPAPKEPSEYAVHPQAPSQSRRDELATQWVENEFHPEYQASEGQRGGPIEGDFDLNGVFHTAPVFGYVD